MEKTKQEMKELVEQRLEIVIHDIAGTDEDVNIHGELEEYKNGFRDALNWILDNMEAQN